MKYKIKFFALTLLILSAQNSLATDPIFKKGEGDKSIVAGIDNEADGWYGSAFGSENKANESFSSAFGYKNTAGDSYSSAFGSNNTALGYNSSAFGYKNTASKKGTSAFGLYNTASGNFSSAFGYNNTASGARSGAFGYGNNAFESDSFAFGYSNTTKGIYSLAFGYVNTANATNSSAFGISNTVDGNFSSAFGYKNSASGTNSSAFGYEVAVSGDGSGAFGRGRYDSGHVYTVAGKDSWAIGSYNKIESGSDNNHILGNNIAIGAGINSSIVLGNNSTVETSNTLSIGSATNKRRIVHVAEGTADTDAVNVRQLNLRAKNDASNLSVSDLNAWKTKLGVGDSIDAYTKAETNTKLNTKANIADVYTKADSNNKFLDKSAYNIDKATFATKTDINTKVNKDGSNLSASDVANWKTKLGVGSGGGAIDAYTKAETDTKLGAKADKSDVYTKVDTDNKFLDKNVYDTDKATFATKTDLNSKANKTDVYTKTESNNKFAEKSNVYSKAESDNKYLNKTTYDTDKATFATKTELNDKANKADVYTKVETDDKLNTKANKDGSNLSASDIATWKAKLATGSVSSIANTADGTESTGLGYGNVVTGNYSTAVGYKNNVSGNNSGAFGDPNTITGNRSYAVGNDNNIAGDDNFVVGSNVTVGTGIKNSVALGNNSTVSNSNEVSVGSAGKERKITNVADGELSETSTDAVNVRQLFKVANSISAGNTDALRKEFRRENEKVKNEVRQVGSLSAALSALHPLQYDKNKPNQIMAGFGQYRDKSAVAVGMAHYFTENLMMTGGVSLSEESNTKAMANVGLTWKFGKGGSESTNAPNYVVQNEISRLAKENNEQKDLIRQQNLKLQSQDERIKNLENKLEILLKTK